MHPARRDAAAIGQEQDPFLDALDDAVSAVTDQGIPCLLIGGIASTVWGRDRGTSDIDLFVGPESMEQALGALEEYGFAISVPSPHWLSKATRANTTVDVIYRAARDILLDEEMLSRSRRREFRGRTVQVISPEDLIVMKAIATAEDTPRYWYDALGVLARAELDWDYLERRARQHGAARVLSLLFFANSIDLLVPPSTIEALCAAILSGGRDGQV